MKRGLAFQIPFRIFTLMKKVIRKKDMERQIQRIVDELSTVNETGKKLVIKYGNGEENYAFEVGYLNARISQFVYELKSLTNE